MRQVNFGCKQATVQLLLLDPTQHDAYLVIKALFKGMLIRPETAVGGGNLLGRLWWRQLIQHHGESGQVVPAGTSRLI